MLSNDNRTNPLKVANFVSGPTSNVGRVGKHARQLLNEANFHYLQLSTVFILPHGQVPLDMHPKPTTGDSEDQDTVPNAVTPTPLPAAPVPSATSPVIPPAVLVPKVVPPPAPFTTPPPHSHPAHHSAPTPAFPTVPPLLHNWECLATSHVPCYQG